MVPQMGAKAVRCFLLALVGLLCFTSMHVSADHAHSCPLRNSGQHPAWAELLVEDPEPNDAIDTVCPLTAHSTCCSAAFADAWANSRDPVYEAVDTVMQLHAASPECMDVVNELRCLPCNDEQDLWVAADAAGTDVSVCVDLCTRLLQACGDTLLQPTFDVQGRTVAQYFTGHWATGLLCYDVTSSLWTALVDPEPCYDPAVPPCTQDDYFSVVSSCDYSTFASGRHTISYHWKADVTCQGGVHLPEKASIACDIECDAGEYVDATTSQCTPCPAGHMSVGGGVDIRTWDRWPSMLAVNTYCQDASYGSTGDILPSDECAGWALNDTFVDSGTNGNSVASVLEVSVNLVDEGSILFEWAVDAEYGWDKFHFVLDGEVAIEPISVSNWTSFQADLAPGLHHFRWVYVKDWGVSQGEDRVFMRRLRVLGITFADLECTPCPVGHDTEGEEGHTHCHPCPDNMYASSVGTPRCDACPASMYAFEGATACTPRKPCAEDDYVGLWSACVDSVSGPRRTKHFAWLQPRVCDVELGVPLPDNVEGPCADCHPGFQRHGDAAECEPCPDGFFLEPELGAQGHACQSCGAGHHAPKVHYWDEWAEWPSHVTHGCDGEDCEAAGWRLMEDYVDSGVGNGREAEPWLRLWIFVDDDGGSLEWSHSVECGIQYPGWCEVEWTDEGHETRQYYATDNVATYRAVLTPGFHTIAWRLRKREAHRGDHSNTRLLVHHIRADGVSDGSAHECIPCEAGYAAAASSATCTQCPAGTASQGEGASTCVPCASDAISSEPGANACETCGAGTLANDDHTECVTDCTWTASEGWVFNLSALEQPNMWGPVRDAQGFTYFVSMCNKEDRIHACHDSHGDPVTSFACQVLHDGTGLDVGDRMAFELLPDGEPRDGLMLSFTGGDPHGCPEADGRHVHLQLLCDPSAGRGFPGPPQSTDPIENPSHPCHYNMVWPSLYACPVCTSAHWVESRSPCMGGEQRVAYRWLEQPKRCHDGLPLPQDYTAPCSLPQPCEPGSYWSSVADGGSCVLAEPGHFALGDGFAYEEWPADATPAQQAALGFSTSCDVAASVGGLCTGWRWEDYAVESGVGDSTLVTERNFLRDGHVSFDYKASITCATCQFTFSVDGEPLLTTGAFMSEWATVTYPIGAGTHTLEWHMSGGSHGSAAQRPQTVSVDGVWLHGIGSTLSAAEPCPAGKHAPEAGAPECEPCPWNTFAPAGSSRCQPCRPGQWAPPGSAFCIAQVDCTESEHYQALYGPCHDGVRTKYVVPLQPHVCKGDLTFPNITVSCAPCPPHLISSPSNDGTCVPCPGGEYPSDSGDACVQAAPGTAAEPVVSFLWRDDAAQWPVGWTTGCSGRCGSPGWRLRGDHIDSGFHGTGEVDSWVEAHVQVASAGGRVSFVYRVESGADGLDFFVDGVAQAVYRDRQDESVTFALSGGRSHTLRWVYHQSYGTTGAASLRYVLVSGVAHDAAQGSLRHYCPPGTASAAAGSTACLACRPGFHAENGASTACTPCPPDTITWESGSAVCVPCGAGTYANSSATHCSANGCRYTFPGDERHSWDLSNLDAHGYVSDGGLQGRAYRLTPCTSFAEAGNAEVSCVDPVTGEELDTYVCERDVATGTVWNAGRVMAFELPATETGPAEAQLRLSFRDGDSEGCADSGFGFPVSRETHVQLECLPAGQESDTRLELISVEKECIRHFHWRTRFACPVCTLDDYEEEDSECVDGKQTVTHVLINVNCWGPSTLVSTHEGCPINYAVPTFGIIIGLVSLAGIIGAIVILVIRNRSISSRYHHLVSNMDGDVEGMAPTQALDVEGGTGGAAPALVLVDDDSTEDTAVVEDDDAV